jgi:DNA gyrase subunit A
VRLMNLDKGNKIVAVARNAEAAEEEAVETADVPVAGEGNPQA